MRPKRILPPAGAPLYLRDLLSGVSGMIRPAKALERLEEELQSYFETRHVFLASSGKAALTLILKSLSQITGRREVVIPSYTCFSVPSAVVRAGLKPVICDIRENDFNYDLHHLKEVAGKKTLCVVATHLFGIPCDVESAVSVARSVGSFVLEDCAQAFGAELGQRRVGTIGDVGFFSLGRGKNLSAVAGGIIITGDERIADALRDKIAQLSTPGRLTQLISFWKALFIYLFSRPRLYRFPAGIPFLGIGNTIFSTKFPIKKLAGFNAGLAGDWKRKLGSFTGARRSKADMYRSKLENSGLAFFREPEESFSVYLRFPVVAPTHEEREAAIRHLSTRGLGASPNYPSGIAEIPALQMSREQKARTRKGNDLAGRIFTLPTHPHVQLGEIETIAEVLRERDFQIGLCH